MITHNIQKNGGRMVKKKVLVAGSIVLDIIPEVYIPKGEPIPEIFLSEGKQTECSRTHIYLGGEVGNTGLGLKKLGCDVRLVSKIGDDSVGEIVREMLQRYDVDFSLIEVMGEQSSTSVAIALPGKDKMTLHSRGASQLFKAADITDDMLEGVKLFHFGYPPSMKYMVENGGVELENLLKNVKSKGITVSLDMSLPDLKTFLGKVDWKPILKKILPYVDLFLPSLEESIFFLHRDEYIEMVRKAGANDLLDYIDVKNMADILADELLELGGTVVMLKCGHEGMYLRTAEKEKWRNMGKAAPEDLDNWYGKRIWENPVKVKKILSRTGAGDIAIAGFLSAFLHGDNPKTALGIAAWAASRCIQSYDTISGLRPLKDL